MLATGLDRLQSLVSREFVLAWFIPWLVFAASNVAVYEFALSPDRSLLDWYTGLDAFKQSLAGAAVLFSVAILAYATTPLSGVMRAGLEGRLLPRSVKLTWRRHAWRIRAQLTAETDALTEAYARLVPADRNPKEERILLMKKTINARNIGNRRQSSQRCHESGLRAKASAIENLDLLMVETDLAYAASKQFDDAKRALWRALINIDGEENRSELQPLIVRLRDTFNDLVARIEYALPAAAMLRDRNYPRDHLAATRFGNVGNAIRSHVFSCYGLDSDYFWPRLRTSLRKDAEIQRQITEYFDAGATDVILRVPTDSSEAVNWSIVDDLAPGAATAS